MSENKFSATDASVEAFISKLAPDRRKSESRDLIKLFSKVTGIEPVLWTSNIIGFGSYEYKYPSGREGVSVRLGFSPRKAKLSIYIMPGFDAFQEQLSRLGKHKTGSSCLYINKLSDVDLSVLQEILEKSWKIMNERYPV